MHAFRLNGRQGGIHWLNSQQQLLACTTGFSLAGWRTMRMCDFEEWQDMRSCYCVCALPHYLMKNRKIGSRGCVGKKYLFFHNCSNRNSGASSGDVGGKLTVQRGRWGMTCRHTELEFRVKKKTIRNVGCDGTLLRGLRE